MPKQADNRFRTAALLFLLLAAGAGQAGCAAQQWEGFAATTSPDHVWPPPPEKPRVAFVQEIRDVEDLFVPQGFWKAVGRLVAGKTDTRLVRPLAPALHPEGGLLVADPGKGLVHFYDWANLRYVAVGPKRPGGLPSPVGTAVTRDGRILVSDSRLGAVESFDADGRWLGPFTQPGAVSRPGGIAVDPQSGEIYVADITNHTVVVLDETGRVVRRIGERGEGPGAFNFPTHVALDGKGRLVVSDSMNFRAQVLRTDGTFLASAGGLGKEPGRFARPKGVAATSKGRIVVVEGLYDALEFFDSEGRFLLHMGRSGNGPGEFWLPAGLAYDAAEGLLFVADSYNSRVQVFRILDEAPSSLQGDRGE